MGGAVKQESFAEFVSGRRLAATLLKGIAICWKASPAGLLSITAMSVAGALVPTGILWCGKELIDTLARRSGSEDILMSALPYVLGLGVLAGFEEAVQVRIGSRQALFTRLVEKDMQQQFLEAAACVELSRFDDAGWQSRLSRIRQDIEVRSAAFPGALLAAAGQIAGVGGMVGLLIAMDPILVVLALTAVVPVTAVSRRMGRLNVAFSRSRVASDREKAYVIDLLTSPRIAKEIRAYDLGGTLVNRYQGAFADDLVRRATHFRRVGRFVTLRGLLTAIPLVWVYLIVASRVVDGVLSLGALSAVTGAFLAVSANLGAIGSSLIALDSHGQFLHDFFTFVESKRPVPLPSCVLPPRLEEGIRFEDVWLAYPTADGHALKGVSLVVNPGELLAIVGENGAGKTTIVKALLGLYEIERGTVFVGGVRIADLDPRELRERCGVIFQDFAAYEVTIRESVAMGRPGRPANDKEIWEALDAARIADVVRRAGSGLDLRVGRLFEGGRDLSGGEWQRLALSRLVYRNADIWVLDEPTAGLDPETEFAVFSEIRERLGGRVGIVISHRFSTVRAADRIAVMSAGTITESGTHDELISRGGRYARMFESQAVWYR